MGFTLNWATWAITHNKHKPNINVIFNKGTTEENPWDRCEDLLSPTHDREV